jgi:protein-tyrosine phosphatase
MAAEVYEISPCPVGELAIMPRPRGGEWLMGELASLKFRGVTDLVSLLSADEEIELGLQSEEPFCADLRMRFHRHPIPDHELPVQPAFDEFVTSLLPNLAAPGFIAIHCRAGIGRSTVVAAALLCRLGLSASDALALISQARGFDVPDTEAQHDFILSLGEKSSG